MSFSLKMRISCIRVANEDKVKSNRNFMKYYYYLWVDAANALKLNSKSDTEIRITSLMYISGIMALKILVLVGLLESLLGTILHIKVQQFDSNKLNQIATFIANYLLLPIAFNYILVIRKTQWNKISEKYSRQKMNVKIKIGHFLGFYFVASLVFVVLSALLFAILPRVM